MTKDNIIALFFEEKLQPTEIASRLNVGKSYITKIIKSDTRYANEKAARKVLNKAKNKAYKIQFMNAKREIERRNRTLDAFLICQHVQAAAELSQRISGMSNRTFRKWNSSAYIYDNSKNRFEFDNSITGSYAVPKYIK